MPALARLVVHPAHPWPIMLPIPGTSSIEHLEQNVAAASLGLAEEDYKKLSRVPELVASR